MKRNRMWNRGLAAALTAAVVFGSSAMTGLAATSIVIGLANGRKGETAPQTESEALTETEAESETGGLIRAEESDAKVGAEGSADPAARAGTEGLANLAARAGAEGLADPAAKDGAEESKDPAMDAGTAEQTKTGTEAEEAAESETGTEELAETELSTEESAAEAGTENPAESETDTEARTEEPPVAEVYYEDSEVLVAVTALGETLLPGNTEVRVEKLTTGAEFEEAKSVSAENAGISEDAVYTVYHVALVADGKELDIPEDMVSIQFRLRELPTGIEEPAILQIDDTDSGKVVQDITDQAISAAAVTE